MAAPDIILEALVGRVEGFTDGHGEILPGLPIDRNLRSGNAHGDPHADAPGPRMLPGTVHRHATFLDSLEEMSQLLGSLGDVPDMARRQELALINDLRSNGHRASNLRAESATEARRAWFLRSGARSVATEGPSVRTPLPARTGGPDEAWGPRR